MSGTVPIAGGDGQLPIPSPVGLVERGLAVFPVVAGGKTPAIADWPNRCVSDVETIRRTWRPGWNVGVGCKASGLLVVDLDRHHDDADGIATWQALTGGTWPETVAVRTPRGVHLYFWAPSDRALGNTSGRLGPGIDTRGPGDGRTDGGYVVGPGSVVDGRAYVVVADLPIAPLPGWIAGLLDKPRWSGQARPVGPLPAVRDRYVSRAVQGEVQRVMDAKPGERNDSLNRSAFALGTIVGAGVLDEADAVTALRAAADAVGLVSDDGDRQVDATIRSGLTAGIRKPRIMGAK